MFLTNEEIKRYDTIVGTVVANVLSEAARTNNEIYLKWFDMSKPAHRVYFHGATIGSLVLKTKVYLDMPFFKYIWFKLTHRRVRKQFSYVPSHKVPLSATPVQAIIDHIEQHYEFKPNDPTWQIILECYYEPKKGAEKE